MSKLRLLDPMFSDSFENTMRRFFSPATFDMEPAPLLKMRVDVTENDQAYEVKADIPGVKKEDILGATPIEANDLPTGTTILNPNRK